MNQTRESAPDYYMFLLRSALSCHGRLWKTKRPMTGHLLREDCGYELLFTKQLNQEQVEGPEGKKDWSRGGGGSAALDEVVLRKWLQRSRLYVAYQLLEF